MLQYMLKLLLTLKSQNCSIGLMLRGNETPILTSTFELLRHKQFEYTPFMLQDGRLADSYVPTELSFLLSYVYLINYKGPMSYQGETVTDCFVLMMENVLTTKDKQAILRNSASRKLIIIVGEHFFSDDYSPTPIIHLNSFGYMKVYCPTLNRTFWAGYFFPLEEFTMDLEIDFCPIMSYAR